MHLLDPATDRYNEPFLGPGLRLLRGYVRMQGIATRADETRDTAALLADASLRMVNRNRGSGTRVLIDEVLASAVGPDGSPLRPAGFAYEPRSHHAVAAAIAQGRADWGVTIEPVARARGLRFRPLRAEHYDFAIPVSRWDRPAVQALRRLLAAETPLRAELEAMGFGPPEENT
jgi:putative molybdopterin biosynthesis protein